METKTIEDVESEMERERGRKKIGMMVLCTIPAEFVETTKKKRKKRKIFPCKDIIRHPNGYFASLPFSHRCMYACHVTAMLAAL